MKNLLYVTQQQQGRSKVKVSPSKRYICEMQLLPFLFIITLMRNAIQSSEC